jgi:hypothetical protein
MSFRIELGDLERMSFRGDPMGAFRGDTPGDLDGMSFRGLRDLDRMYFRGLRDLDRMSFRGEGLGDFDRRSLRGDGLRELDLGSFRWDVLGDLDRGSFRWDRLGDLDRARLRLRLLDRPFSLNGVMVMRLERRLLRMLLDWETMVGEGEISPVDPRRGEWGRADPRRRPRGVSEAPLFRSLHTVARRERNVSAGATVVLVSLVATGSVVGDGCGDWLVLVPKRSSTVKESSLRIPKGLAPRLTSLMPRCIAEASLAVVASSSGLAGSTDG